MAGRCDADCGNEVVDGSRLVEVAEASGIDGSPEGVGMYLSTFTESLLGPVESEDATTADAAGVFAAIALLFRGDLGNRGCLVVNAIGELAGRDPSAARHGAALYERYHLAFANALGRESEGTARDEGVVLDRAHVLAVAAMGVWITSRVDPAAAAQACDAMVRQIAVWGHARPRRRSGIRS
jgi:hypothetical protein